MLIFDQLKKNDPHLRLLALAVLVGFAVLASGLWWVQVVSARDYQANLETQSFRTVRIPAVRGKIMDRNGIALAENGPTYNVSLYLEELKDQFQKEYKTMRPRKVVTNTPPIWKRWLGSSAVQTQYVRLSSEAIEDLRWQSRYRVAQRAVSQISEDLKKPLPLDTNDFKRHYLTKLALPYPVAQRIGPTDIARFEEQTSSMPGMDLDVQSTRSYPKETLAAHLLGHLKKDDSSSEGEEAFFNYRLPDFRGAIGLEYAFDADLHGKAGAKSVLVNNLGYRQTENIWSPAAQGKNLVLTIDAHIQEAVEKALQSALAPAPVKGAAVVMDVNSGDIMALASAPAYNPNYFVQGFPPGEYQRFTSIEAERNRATQDNYRPGSIFKPVVALACLESGLNPEELYTVQPHTRLAGQGGIFVGRREIADTAHPGQYSFKRALIHSSNSYFINYGLRAGVDRIAEMGRRLHLGEYVGLNNRQETSGTFPDARRITHGWTDGDTANLCIGQGYIDVTPLQMAVVAAAIANGGKVLWPRLVDRIEPANPDDHSVVVFPKAQVRDNLGVKPRTLRILEEAMLADTEDPEGTAYTAFKSFAHHDLMRVCGKTGTAQNEHGGAVAKGMQTTWFLSFAPYEKPRYAVVVMVESGSSGGGTCAPVARQIYEAIVARQIMSTNVNSVARTN